MAREAMGPSACLERCLHLSSLQFFSLLSPLSNSYYTECVPGLVAEGKALGYTATTISSFLVQHPVPADDVVHVEDGAWINHADDFGDPAFVWGWMGVPRLLNKTYSVTSGWDCNARQWAIITASQVRACASSVRWCGGALRQSLRSLFVCACVERERGVEP